MNKEEKDNNYWNGYIKKQKESIEICKMCKYRKRYKELKQKETILDKVTDKLKEDAREEEGYIKWLDERTQEISQSKKTIIVKSDYARSILNIIEGEKK